MAHLYSSGHPKPDSLLGVLFARYFPAGDENPRIRFFVYLAIAMTCLLFGIFIVDLFSTARIYALSAALAATGQIIGLLALRYGANPRIAFRVSTMVMLSYGLFLLSIDGLHGPLVHWMLVFPAFSSLLFGDREGRFWTAVGFIGILFALLDRHNFYATFSAQNLRFLLTYAFLAVLAGAFDSVVHRVQVNIAGEKAEELEMTVGRLSAQMEERRRAEEALRLGEERFRTFSEATFEGIGLTDVGTFVDLNDQLASMLGYERSELIGKPVVQCVAPEHRELVQEAIHSGTTSPYEHLALRKDGSRLLVEAQAGTSTVAGRVIRTTALRDLTDRKKAEEEIREAKEYAEAILDSLPGTFFVFDEQLRLTRWNKNFALVAAHAPEELPGKNPFELIEEKDRDSVSRAISASIAGGSTTVEARALTKTGMVPYLFTAVWRTLGEGQYLLGTGIDISDRKRTEELLVRSEGLFRMIFETAPDAIAISKTERGIFVDVNRNFLDLTGYTRDEVIGESSIKLNLWADPGIREKMIENLVSDGSVQNLEFDLKCKDGTLKQVLFSAGRVLLDGELHILSTTKDITDLKRAEAERLRLEIQVRHAQKLESLGILAGGIAHDFNNILTSILGNADLALLRLSSLSPARDNIEEIQRGALRAAGLANQMLAYSGKGKFELKSIDLSALVKEMAQLLEVSISKKAVVTYDLVDGLPFIEGDVNQIQQIVMNLITNASESLDEEGGMIRLSTASAFCDGSYLTALRDETQYFSEEPLSEGMYVSLEVTDTGCGMDDETQSKVFDPFFTTKFSGRGLGMSAVLGIVQGHKGIIRIYSEIGRGTTFKILLPAREGSVISRTPVGDHHELFQPWEEGVVLVADDEAIIRRVVKGMLESMNLRVLTASDGNQAVEVFRENVDQISCVLLDLTMPGLDGLQAFREMRRINPNVEVILCSGYNEQEVTQRFVGKGLAGFIQKPYTLDKLKEKLNELFRKK